MNGLSWAVFITLLAGSVGYAEPQIVRYRFGSALKEFVSVSPNGPLISAACWPPAKAKLPCQVHQRLKQGSTARLDISGGKNPGAVICGQIGGHIAVGVSENGSQQSFCQFKDGSMASSGTVHAQAIQNDLAR